MTHKADLVSSLWLRRLRKAAAVPIVVAGHVAFFFLLLNLNKNEPQETPLIPPPAISVTLVGRGQVFDVQAPPSSYDDVAETVGDQDDPLPPAPIPARSVSPTVSRSSIPTTPVVDAPGASPAMPASAAAGERRRAEPGKTD